MDAFEHDDYFNKTLETYTHLVAKAVNTLCKNSNVKKEEIAAIGLHGQTCDHLPPSLAQGQEEPYTLQVFDAQLLADLTNIPVIYDFRSDDLMNGGEAAPLAPLHNLHIAKDLKQKGIFPLAFCNAGNTGNIAIISETKNKQSVVNGWDIGPFNHFCDRLMQTYQNKPCDLNGEFGQKGNINLSLLEELFHQVAQTKGGDNFYLLPPPKSSDPSWYQMEMEKICKRFGFEDTLRTSEYLSAYTYFHSLCFVDDDVLMPQTFLLFGGGWKNPLILSDFKALFEGNRPILKEHEQLFKKIRSHFKTPPKIENSDTYGYSGAYMEARIFADMAYCRMIKEPFSLPETTKCFTPTIAGIYVLPKDKKNTLLEEIFQTYQSQNLIENSWSKKWNRASKGWQKNSSLPPL